MSYILEALKKSEQERERGNVPDIKSIHSSSESVTDVRKRSWWPYLLVAILLINGAIFTVVYLGKDQSSSTASQVDKEQQAASLASEKPVEIETDIKVQGSPPQVSQSQALQPQASQSKQADVPPKAVVEPTAQPQPKVIFSKEPLDMSSDVVITEAPVKASESGSDQEVVEENIQAMLISELPDTVRQGIPNIEFAGHVYSSVVERRSVMINGRKMREGDAVSANLFLHAITPEGAEFDYQGYRFKLNALQDWSSR